MVYFLVTSNQKEVQPDSSEKKVKFSDVQGVSLRHIVVFSQFYSHYAETLNVCLEVGNFASLPKQLMTNVKTTNLLLIKVNLNCVEAGFV